MNEPDITGRVACQNIPEKPGVYLVTDEGGGVLYVGSSNSLRRRIAYLHAHVNDKSSGGFIHDASDPLMKYQEQGHRLSVHYIICQDYKIRERILMNKYKPPWNKAKK